MAVEKPEGTIVLISFIGGSSYFQVSEQGPSFWREMLSENHNALVTYIGHYISTLYIACIEHYIGALFNLGFMFIHCHER